MKKGFINLSVFLALFSLLFFISSRDKENYIVGNWRSTLFVDPAGYNVYLPATFQYGFIHKFPPKTDSIVAQGFMLDKDQKVVTKFTYGVALLQSPFYITGLIISEITGIENTGYSFINQLLVDIAGIFYACFAVIVLFFILRRKFSKPVSFLSTVLIFIGTNTLYYASIQPGMSHIYSFSLVVFSLYLSLLFFEQPTLLKFCFFSFCVSLLILIRPLNVLIVPVLLFFYTNSYSDVSSRIRFVFKLRYLLSFFFIFFLVFLPQLIYWKFTFGHFIADSYTGESFTFLSHPRIKEFLFSPHNGLIVYSPLYLFLLFSLIPLYNKYRAMALTYGIVFITLIYLSASWYLFYFGCGFGARNFVEYSGLLAFPLAQVISDYKTLFKKTILFFVIPVLVINLKLMYDWEICYSGSNDWSWKEYNYLLYKPHKQIIQNLDSVSDNKIITYKNEKVYYIDSIELYSEGITFRNSTWRSYFKRADISVDLLLLDANPNAQLACMSDLGNTPVFYNASVINGPINKWTNFKLFTYLPFNEEKDYEIRIFLMNNHKKRFYMKNLKVNLN